MKKLKSIFAICTVAVMIASCQKEGPEGPQGIQGIQGEHGLQGVPGQDGNANVHSVTFSYTWASNDFPFYTYTLNCPTSNITSVIINDGAVLGYVSTNNGVNWNPITYYISLGANSHIYFRGSISDGNYAVIIGRDDGGNVTSSLISSTIKVKVVTIAGSARMENPNVNFNNYEEVKKVFNLKD
jgi:hypothetical protein